ncbi:MFS transporter [Pseudomonas sp. PD9R]|uniref:MFS transporter n=1 Tax=Pseudomonas sp. PD9R TaxID=2853534 RepID=UPI001C45AC7A|nr:MFS transporter [Pseudomonas sp. PD9R]MBV6826521.1 MFS transporter [Pseudomonas sp. PD9R]
MEGNANDALPFFVGMNLLSGLSMGLANITLPLFAMSLGSTPATIGLLAICQSVGVLLMGLPAGLMVDRFGPKRLLIIGSITVGGLYLLLSQASNVATLAVVVSLVSCLMPLRSVALSALFMQKISQVGVTKAGWFRGCYMGGQVLLAPLAAAAMIGHFGYPYSYLLIGGCFTLLLVFLSPVTRTYRKPSSEAPPLSLQALKQQLSVLRSDPQLRRNCTWELALQATNQFFTFFIAIIAIKRFHVELAAATSLITLNGVCYVAALLFAGRLAQRFGESVLRRLGCVLSASALLALGLADSIQIMRLAAPLLGAGMGMIQVISLSGLARCGARHGPGRVSGVTIFLFPLGGLLGSALGGIVGDYLDLQTVFFLLAPVFVIILGQRTFQHS